MKKLLIASILAIIISALPARAQYEAPLHEFSLGMGDINISGMAIGMNLYSHDNIDRNKMFGPLNMEYFYRLDKPCRGKLKIGVQLAYFYYDSAFHYDSLDESPNGYLAERDTDNCFSIIPAVKLNYVQTKYFDMYLGLGLGVTFRFNEGSYGEQEFYHHNKIHPNGHLTLLGLEGGHPNLRFFLEAGIGEQGIVKYGLRYRM